MTTWHDIINHIRIKSNKHAKNVRHSFLFLMPSTQHFNKLDVIADTGGIFSTADGASSKGSESAQSRDSSRGTVEKEFKIQEMEPTKVIRSCIGIKLDDSCAEGKSLQNGTKVTVRLLTHTCKFVGLIIDRCCVLFQICTSHCQADGCNNGIKSSLSLPLATTMSIFFIIPSMKNIQYKYN